MLATQSIMLALREGDDETAQLAALNELCELLAVSSEDALSMFPVDTLVPILVRNMADVKPSTSDELQQVRRHTIHVVTRASFVGHLSAAHKYSTATHPSAFKVGVPPAA